MWQVNLNTLKGWVKLRNHPHICEICEKAFPYKASLKKHVLTHQDSKSKNSTNLNNDEDVKQNIRYDPAFKNEVATFALSHSIPEAIAKYQLAHSTINNWVKILSNPKPCHLCGKGFAEKSTVRGHIEQVHKHTPDGEMELARRQQELTVQSFSKYLAENDLLPTEEMIRAREVEKEKKKKEKLKLAVVAREILAREELKLKDTCDDKEVKQEVQETETIDKGKELQINIIEHFGHWVYSGEENLVKDERFDNVDPTILEPDILLSQQPKNEGSYP